MSFTPVVERQPRAQGLGLNPELVAELAQALVRAWVLAQALVRAWALAQVLVRAWVLAQGQGGD